MKDQDETISAKRIEVIQQSQRKYKTDFATFLQEMPARDLFDVFFKRGLFKNEIQAFTEKAWHWELPKPERGIIKIYGRNQKIILKNTAWEALIETYRISSLPKKSSLVTQTLVSDLLLGSAEGLNPTHIVEYNRYSLKELPPTIVSRIELILPYFERTNTICQRRAIECIADFEAKPDKSEKECQLLQTLEVRRAYFALTKSAKNKTLTIDRLEAYVKQDPEFAFYMKDPSGVTALSYALLHNNNEVAKWLVDHRPKGLSLSSYVLETVYSQNNDLFKYIYDRYPEQVEPLADIAAVAASNGNIDIFRILAKKHALKPEKVLGGQYNPASRALAGRQFVVMQILANHGITYEGRVALQEIREKEIKDALLWGGYKDATLIQELVTKSKSEEKRTKFIKIRDLAEDIQHNPHKYIEEKCTNATFSQLQQILFLIDESFSSHESYRSLIAYVCSLLVERLLSDELWNANSPYSHARLIIKFLLEADIEQDQLKSILIRLYRKLGLEIEDQLAGSTIVSNASLKRHIAVKLQELKQNPTVESQIKIMYLSQADYFTSALHLDEIKEYYNAVGQGVTHRYLLLDNLHWDLFKLEKKDEASSSHSLPAPLKMMEIPSYQPNQLLEQLQKVRKENKLEKKTMRSRAKKKVLAFYDQNKDDKERFKDYLQGEDALVLYHAFFKFGTFNTTAVQSYSHAATLGELGIFERGVVNIYRDYQEIIDSNTIVMRLMQGLLAYSPLEVEHLILILQYLFIKIIEGKPISLFEAKQIDKPSFRKLIEELKIQYQKNSATIQFRCQEYNYYLDEVVQQSKMTISKFMKLHQALIKGFEKNNIPATVKELVVNVYKELTKSCTQDTLRAAIPSTAESSEQEIVRKILALKELDQKQLVEQFERYKTYLEGIPMPKIPEDEPTSEQNVALWLTNISQHALEYKLRAPIAYGRPAN